MVSSRIGRVCHKLMLFSSNNLLVLGPLKVSLAKAILLFKQLLSSHTGRVLACLHKIYSPKTKLVLHVNATSRPLVVWFKRRGQTKADRFLVVFSHRHSDATTSSGLMSHLVSLASNSRRQSLPKICQPPPHVIAAIRVCRYAYARRAQTQADGFSNARSHKARGALSLHGLMNHRRRWVRSVVADCQASHSLYAKKAQIRADLFLVVSNRRGRGVDFFSGATRSRVLRNQVLAGWRHLQELTVAVAVINLAMCATSATSQAIGQKIARTKMLAERAQEVTRDMVAKDAVERDRVVKLLVPKISMDFQAQGGVHHIEVGANRQKLCCGVARLEHLRAAAN